MKIGYFINDKFVLDDGTPAGVNVMLFNGENLDYWFEEQKVKSVKEAKDFIEDISHLYDEIIPIMVRDCPNRAHS